MATELLLALWEGLLASSAGCLLVLLLRRPWARLFGATTTPLLWALVPLSLLAVWLPAPSHAVQEGWSMLPALDGTAAPSTAQTTDGEAAGVDLALLLAPWAAGSALATLYFVLLQRRFRRQLGRLREQPDGTLLAERADIGPAVLGALRPRIVLPADFHTRYSTDEQALILAHERSHQRRGDVLANAIATGLRAVYWFNPLLHYAADRLRHDHELASDAEVVQRFPHARRRYADTLLNVQLAVPGLPVGCLWQSSHPLKERIAMLTSHPVRPGMRRLGTLSALALMLAAASLAWATQPARTSGASAATHRIQLAITLGGETHRPELHFALGEAFGVAIDARGERWNATFTVTAANDGYRLQGTLDNGKDAPFTPELLTGTNGEFAITVDSDQGGTLQLAADISPLPADPTTRQAAAAIEQEASYAAIRPPTYPPSALDAAQAGTVLLQVDVGVDGRPTEVSVAEATLPGVFDDAAIAAVKTWRFNPAIRDGAPVASKVAVPICFALTRDEAACPSPEGALDGIFRTPPEAAPKG